MPIAYEATNAADRKAGKAIVLALGKALGSDHVGITFAPDAVTIASEDLGIDTTLTRDEFDNWKATRFAWDNGPVLTVPNPAEEAAPPAEERPIRPQPKPSRKSKAKGDKTEAVLKKVKAPKPKAEPKPKAPRKPKVEDASDLVADLAAQALDIAAEEASGEHGRNAARFKRGELMLRLTGISQAAKVPAKKLLKLMNERTITLASASSIPDFHPITEQEASTTRRVVQAFGSSGEFNLLDAVDPATGNPLLNDAGEPYQVPLTEVAMNKLYPLVEYAEEGHLDTLLSFAYRNSEKVVKAAKRVAKSLEKPIMTVIEDTNKMRVTKPSPLGEEVGAIEVPPDEKEIVRALREMMGEAPEPDIASLKTSRAWYEGTWNPLKSFVSSVARAFIPEVVNESSGEVSNVFILERILTQLFHPLADGDKGAQRILGALVEAGDLTEGQAHDFVDSFAFDPESERWERIVSGVVPSDAAILDNEDESDDEDDFPDIDEPTPEEPEEDDDFDDDL